MKKLFLFSGGGEGAYLGGMAGATADSWQGAFQKLQDKYESECGYFPEFFLNHAARGKEWAFIPFEQVWAEKEMIFCECHDG